MRLGIIGCCKSKGPIAAPARALYTGDLFVKSLAWSQQNCDHTIILSALYHVVELASVIAPYELTLINMGKLSRKAWSLVVRDQLEEHYADWTYVYLTGTAYHEYLPRGEYPLDKLRFGERLQWLKENTHG